MDISQQQKKWPLASDFPLMLSHLGIIAVYKMFIEPKGFL